MTSKIGKRMKHPSTQTRRVVPPVKKKAKELNPVGLTRNKKLKATLSGCSAVFLSSQTGILNACSRLVNKIRLRDGSTSNNNTGLLTKDWDFDIVEREAEFKDDLRAASGIGHKRRKVSIVALL